MRSAPFPEHEDMRLQALESYAILGTEAEASYDALVELTAYICQTPIALISLIDQDRQWFKARVGLSTEETPRELAFCAHAILQEDVFVVEDTLQDPRFADNPLVSGDPKIRFYAGAPLRSREGFGLGTLCAIDTQPRKISSIQMTALETLAEQTRVQLELRRQSLDLERLVQQQSRLFNILGHDLREPFGAVRERVASLIDLSKTLHSSPLRELAGRIDDSVRLAGGLLDNLLTWSLLQTDEMPFHPEELTSLGIMEQAREFIQDSADRKEIRLSLQGDELRCRADRAMLHCMLCNLLSNAVKFSPRGAEIFLSCQQELDQLVFEVRDQGVGIAPECLHTLFSPEPVSTPGTEQESGTGLGLQICQSLAERHYGALELESIPGQGSCCRLRLPFQAA